MLTGLLLITSLACARGNAVTFDEPPAPQRRAYISIVIDDIGYRHGDGLRALELPGQLTFAVLPHTPHAQSFVALATGLGREILVHLPMESLEGHKLGPGGITTQMDKEQVQGAVRESLSSMPEAVGLSNHMGSRVTPDEQRMQWLMEVLNDQPGVLFLDSRTTEASVAKAVAFSNGVPTLGRDVFLDNMRSEHRIERQFMQLLRRARTHGTALGIGHPYPETIRVLWRLLPTLDEHGVELIPVTQLLARRQARLTATLQASGTTTESAGTTP